MEMRKMMAALMAMFIMAIPALCTVNPIAHPLVGIIDSTEDSITHPLAVASNHWDSSDLTLGYKTEMVKEAIRTRSLWRTIWKGLTYPSVCE